MKLKKGFAMRNIAGENIVVPLGKNIENFNGMITLNDSGAFFWNLMQKDTTIEKMVDAVTAEYDVSAERATQDIKNFISILKENNLLDE